MNLEKEWQRVREMFEAYKFPFRVVGKPVAQCWDGERASILHPTESYRSLSDGIHEFAHWWVVDGRLGKVNFGLGVCLDSSREDESSSLLLVSEDAAIAEEYLASCLGICIEDALGLDPDDTKYEHGWYGRYGGRDFMSVRKKLIRKHHLLPDGSWPVDPVGGRWQRGCWMQGPDNG